MSTREEQLHKRQEDLSLVVEPLVDSISELVLLSVTGAFENVQGCCMDIAERTNKLVLIAQQVATSSTDYELQMEVANAINDIALTIEKLVTAFTAILANSNPSTQKDFAAAAKDVGDAINKLCAATDETSQRKILRAVKETIESAKQVQDSAFLGREKLLAAAQLNVEKTVKLVKIATLAAGSTADERKKRLLLEGADKVKQGGPALIQAAKNVSERPDDANNKTVLTQRSQDLTAAFTMLIDAAKLSPTYFGKVAETYEYVRRLIEAAKDLEEAASNLYTTTQTGTAQEFIEAARIAANRALLLVEQAENAARLEKDPVKKVLIRDAIAELREASQAMIRAAKAYRENPDDPKAKADLDQAHQRLEAAIRNVVALTGGELGDQTPRGKMATTANALESAARNLVYAAQHNPKDLIDEANTLAAIAMQFVRDAEAVAAETQDPAERKRILDTAAEINEASQRLIAAAKALAQNPNDPELQRKLAAAHQYLLDKLNQVRREARLIPGQEFSSTELDMRSGQSAEAQLVAAAKEEASAAMQLAAEAEKHASKITDPVRKQRILEAIKEVKLCAQRVVEAAELVSANPHDPVAQQKLASAQRDLGTAIQRVVDLTSGNDRELSDAMAEMKQETDAKGSSETAILAAAEDVLKEIAATFGSNRKMRPEEVIAYAKELSNKANELAKQLRAMADATTDPVYKEKLLNAAKIIRDGAIQIKILSAVRAAGGDADSPNSSVAMSAKGLQTNIQEIIKEVRAQSLKNRFRSTVKQTMAINKVVSVWRKQAAKK